MTDPTSSTSIGADDVDDHVAPPTLAAVMPEPPDDHTPIVLRDQNDEATLVWRDDDTAARHRTARTPVDARWFDGGFSPMTWAQVTDNSRRRAIAAYRLVGVATPWQGSRDVADIAPAGAAYVTLPYAALQAMPTAWQQTFTALMDQYQQRADARRESGQRPLDLSAEADDLVALVNADHNQRGFAGGHGAGTMAECIAPLCCQATLVRTMLHPDGDVS